MLHAKYRPEIDGLRAIAIIAVIIYHFFPAFMPGGFLGVDIFFVISGYLISKIIAGSLRDNTFSLVEFYVRRIKRIFPALLIVSSIFLIYSWFVFLPDEFKQMGRYISYGSLFCTNLALYRDIGYFDGAGLHKPLMHLWSLSVEEQFYVVWPLVLWGFWKLRQDKGIIAFIILSIVASYGLNILLMGYKPNLAFYMPLTRVWELGAGALVAYLELLKKGEGLKKSWLNSLGFLLILGSLFLLDYRHPLFRYLTVLPILGAFFVILNTKQTFVFKILSIRPMVFIGLISYPLYLFHYPLISFPHVIQPALLTNNVKIGLIGLAGVLAYLVYKFVETPIRLNKSRRGAAVLLGLMLLLGAAASFVRYEKVKAFVFYKFPEVMKIVLAVGDWDILVDDVIPFKIDDVPLYRLTPVKNKTTILFLGDSHMEQYRPRIKKVYRMRGMDEKSVVFANYGGMCPIPGIGRLSDPNNIELMKSFRQYALEDDVQEIVIGASWISYFSVLSPEYYVIKNGTSYGLETKIGKDYALKALEEMVGEFVKAGKKVYIMLPTPNGLFEYNPMSLVKRNFIGYWEIFPPQPGSFKEWQKSSQGTKVILTGIAERTGAHLINPEGDFCQGDYCRSATDDGTFIYKDAGHIRPFYARDYVKCLDFLFTTHD